MLDREAWRSRMRMIVKENISSNSGHCRTRGDFVVWFREILSRLVVVVSNLIRLTGHDFSTISVPE
jgi:hypothetical protein